MAAGGEGEGGLGGGEAAAGRAACSLLLRLLAPLGAALDRVQVGSALEGGAEGGAAAAMAAALLAGGQHKLRLSFFELRGEGCYDLLHEQRELVLRDDGTGDIVVCGLQQVS